jgi:hypothetical protein
MQYQVTKCEDKSNDWKVVTVMGIDNIEVSNASVNRTNKKGETFPNFDTVKVGATIEANAWTSDAGKNYLFPPKAKTSYAKKPFTSNQKAVSESVKVAQQAKEESIKISSTIRDAVMIATTMATYEKYGEKEMADKIEFWRGWLLEHWNVDITDTKAF